MASLRTSAWEASAAVARFQTFFFNSGYKFRENDKRLARSNLLLISVPNACHHHGTFSQDLKAMSLKLKYPKKLIDSTFKRLHASQDQDQNQIQ